MPVRVMRIKIVVCCILREVSGWQTVSPLLGRARLMSQVIFLAYRNDLPATPGAMLTDSFRDIRRRHYR